jgi:hypothetical protein
VDAGDSLTYSKVSGPAWLDVASDGTLSGTPGADDEGANAFIVRVQDTALAFDTATLNITVNSAQPPPVLDIRMSGSDMEILWPSSYTGYSLYGTTNLLPPVVWSPLTNAPVGEGDHWMISMPMDEDHKFFRLMAP